LSFLPPLSPIVAPSGHYGAAGRAGGGYSRGDYHARQRRATSLSAGGAQTTEKSATHTGEFFRQASPDNLKARTGNPEKQPKGETPARTIPPHEIDDPDSWHSPWRLRDCLPARRGGMPSPDQIGKRLLPWVLAGTGSRRGELIRGTEAPRADEIAITRVAHRSPAEP